MRVIIIVPCVCVSQQLSMNYSCITGHTLMDINIILSAGQSKSIAGAAAVDTRACAKYRLAHGFRRYTGNTRCL